jgi:RND family efflux transporter MFP subunit
MAMVAVLLGGCGEPGGRKVEDRPAPVEVVRVEVGPISDIRQLSGSLRAASDFTVSAKVAGRVAVLEADIAAEVGDGGLLGQLDSEPFQLAYREAEGEAGVAQANLRAAAARAELAERELNRRRQLKERGFLSDDQFEEAEAQFIAATAAREVAAAQVARATASLEAAEVDLRYTQIRAEWSGGEPTRHVAERYVDEGDRVAVNDPLFRMVSLDPLLAEVFITEADFARLQVGDVVLLQADAYPEREFAGEVVRIAPVFSERSRQVRVEIEVPNPGALLRPGMFVRASLVLETQPAAQLVPEEALVRRNGGNGLFLVEPGTALARWVPVQTGILQDGRLEIVSPVISGEVVVLGQQLIRDGSKVAARERSSAVTRP